MSVSHTLPTVEGTFLNSQHKYERMMLHGHHRMLMSCVQLSFAKESLSFLENKACCLVGILLEVNELSLEALC